MAPKFIVVLVTSPKGWNFFSPSGAWRRNQRPHSSQLASTSRIFKNVRRVIRDYVFLEVSTTWASIPASNTLYGYHHDRKTEEAQIWERKLQDLTRSYSPKQDPNNTTETYANDNNNSSKNNNDLSTDVLLDIYCSQWALCTVYMTDTWLIGASKGRVYSRRALENAYVLPGRRRQLLRSRVTLFAGPYAYLLREIFTCV